MNDGSYFVLAVESGIKRLIGADYLTKQLKALGIDDWQAVETKFYLPKNT